ncbi:MAG: hypothetical protein M3Q88_04310, partial [Pseudomonadota bacterium]|nr:hypothetical protein [Pseudomonadota bacterium]
QPSTVYGGGGDDTIYSEGRNRIFGDDGNDTIHADISGAFIDGGTGNDIIFAGGTEGFPPGTSSIVYGGNGDDIIYGMNADYLYGGSGSDSYEITASRTYIFETATVQFDRGADKVFAYIDFTLPEHVENLIMIYGKQTYGYGNDEANIIIGNASNNVLEGKGGYDTLTGGAGS